MRSPFFRPFRSSAPSSLRVGSIVTLAGILTACSPPEPPKVPIVATPKPLEVTPEAPIDLAPVPEPKNILAVGRIAHAEESSKLLANWSGFPVPSASEALRAAGAVDVASVVDFGKPIDFVARLEGNVRSPSLSFVVSVPLVSLEEARAKLQSHKMTPMANGMIKVHGLGASEGADEEDSTAKVCVLSPAAGTAKARILCGDPSGIEALAPYALRNLGAQPVAPGDADFHVEVRASSIRNEVAGMRRLLPAVVGGFLDNKNGVGAAAREVVEGAIGDLADFAVDSEKVTLDITATPEGARATARYAFKSSEATTTKLLVAGADRVGPPPPALLRLPGDVDFAAWAAPSDKALLERPRKLLSALLDESLEGKMPVADRRALVDAFVTKTLPLAEGGWVFGHGYDREALGTALAATRSEPVEPAVPTAQSLKADRAAAEKKKAAFEQLAGYSLAKVDRPYAEVSQIVKDWVTVGNRFIRANKKKDAPVVRLTPASAALKLPAKTTHIEISVPRPPRHDAKGKVAFTPTPMVCHLFVVAGEASVGEQDATWMGGGCDAKLVGERLMAVRTNTSPTTLGARPESKELVASVSRSGLFVTPRTFAWTKAIGRDEGALGAVGRDGFATVLFTSKPSGPSKDAQGGSVTTTLLLPKAAVGATAGALLR